MLISVRPIFADSFGVEQITAERQFEPPARQCRLFGYHYLFAVSDCMLHVQPFVGQPVQRCLMLGKGWKDIQITTSAERFAVCACQDHNPDRSFLPDSSECIRELLGHSTIDRVSLVRTIKGNSTDRIARAANLVLNGLVVFRFHKRGSIRLIGAITFL
jgi:hypothetical protein